MGPTTLFDKSFIQSLSTDESVWFDRYFYTAIAPLFYIETLADLEKKPRSGKTSEDEVGIIAAKTPQMSSVPCYFHRELCLNDLLGHRVPMTGQIPVARAIKSYRDGKVKVTIKEPEEAKAFIRWQEGRFLEIEREQARDWRSQLARIDLKLTEMAVEKIGITVKNCKSLEDAHRMAVGAIASLAKTYGRFDVFMEMLDVPKGLRRNIKNRWRSLKRPRLMEFAPYAVFVLTVEIFFSLAVAAKLIASTRQSHCVDIAYIFYLPFCNIFISTDKLHRTCAPFFLRSDQRFIWGSDLKSELAELNEYFLTLPLEVRELGIYKFAHRLPVVSNGLIRELYTRYTPSLLEEKADELNNSTRSDLLPGTGDVREQSGGYDENGEGVDYDELVLHRVVRERKGSWIQIARAGNQTV
ncbi:hypothetical protein FNU76_10225 [Chitinimonas arctica]|uniref:Uncharacterized protein n=1 Tax=Chitinimonas arctica TaxID=2594795 RepID=A0A516SF27_9NEIS|nr:hypothetical protein [Chitinimonas arctica]QDQ26710.1 hypothetical protein FNU76_10225 [Chitinimonas arctica]